MNPEEILARFPEMSSLLTNLHGLDKQQKRLLGGQILLSIISALSEDDGDMLSLVDRLEYQINMEFTPNRNPLFKLAMLSRLRHKINRTMDRL